jgi:hypothetical protein
MCIANSYWYAIYESQQLFSLHVNKHHSCHKEIKNDV